MSNNTERITCPDCNNFVVEDPDTPQQKLECAAKSRDFMKQLVSGQGIICPLAERKA